MFTKMRLLAFTASLVLFSSVFAQTLFDSTAAQKAQTAQPDNKPLSPNAFQSRVKSLDKQNHQKITGEFNQQLKKPTAAPPSNVPPPRTAPSDFSSSQCSSPIPPPAAEEPQQTNQSKTPTQQQPLHSITPKAGQTEPTLGTSPIEKVKPRDTYTGFGTGPTGGSGGTQSEPTQTTGGFGIKY